MSGTSPDSVSYPTQSYGLLTPTPAYVFNIQDVPGADPTGNDDSTVALREWLSLIPDSGGVAELAPGIYRFSGNLPIKSNTVIQGSGTLIASHTSEWAEGAPYLGLVNVNNTASVITDENITIRGITINFRECLPYDGTQHCIYLRKARRVTVENCTILGGSDSVALLGCDQTLVQDNALIDFTNCGVDHWDGPSNARVIGNHIETDVSAQMVNFNPDPSSGSGAGYTAQGLTMTGNTLVSNEANATPCQIEPLTAGSAVRDVAVTANIFRNVYLVFRGNTAGVTVSGNIMSGFASGSEAIACFASLGGTPAGIVVADNLILDPLTTVGNLGVIRVETDSSSVTDNIILGSAYGAAPVFRGSTNGQRFGNYADSQSSIGILKNGFYVENGSTKPIGWTDASGTRPAMYCQGDNNWIFQGTNASGAARVGLSWAQRSSTSAIIASVPFQFSSTYRTVVEIVAAAGTIIGTATVLTGNVHNVTTCTAGVADGVQLTATTGRPQTVINSSADTLKVYPNDGGNAQIDAGGVDVPTTIAAGKSKTFVQVAPGDFRTVSAT